MYFIKKVPRYALDVDKPWNVGSAIITWPVHGKINQQWFFKADGTIESGIQDLVLDVRDDLLTPGAPLTVYLKHGGDNQKFKIVTMKPGP